MGLGLWSPARQSKSLCAFESPFSLADGATVSPQAAARNGEPTWRDFCPIGVVDACFPGFIWGLQTAPPACRRRECATYPEYLYVHVPRRPDVNGAAFQHSVNFHDFQFGSGVRRSEEGSADHHRQER